MDSIAGEADKWFSKRRKNGLLKGKTRRTACHVSMLLCTTGVSSDTAVGTCLCRGIRFAVIKYDVIVVVVVTCHTVWK